MVGRRRRAARVLFVIAALGFARAAARADSRDEARDAHEARSVEQLMALLTLDEKLALLEGSSEPASADKQYQAGLSSCCAVGRGAPGALALPTR